MSDVCEGAEEAARDLVRLCCEYGVTVATAESCTAGMVASTIADIPGASSVLRGGAVTYVDEIKHDVLGVSTTTLQEHTAVSHECASEMASGSRSVFKADYAVSTTGYAGPGGGTDDDPVGTVYFGICTPYESRTSRRRCTGSRQAVRHAACAHALNLLVAAITADAARDREV